MAIAVRNEGAKINSNINVTPMVDVMLVLLIIFMVVTPMFSPGYQIQLAKANNSLQMPDADKDDALLVAVNKEGVIFFGNAKVTAAELVPKIRERITPGRDQRVFVKADARAHYKAVVDVVDNVRSAGVNELGLLTEQRRISP
jgi:biopolymer transport protein ExbD/biopolymer transport protein TolR